MLCNMASSAYSATEEITNANRISRLLMGPCTDQFRDLLRFYIEPSKFSEVIQKKKSIGCRSNMSVQSYKLILPKSGSYKGNYDDMDIALLYTLLRNICGIKEHRAGWGGKTTGLGPIGLGKHRADKTGQKPMRPFHRRPSFKCRL